METVTNEQELTLAHNTSSLEVVQGRRGQSS